MSFAELKKKSGNVLELQSKLAQLNTQARQQGDNYWKLEVDKSGNGQAVIRFLAEPKNEDMPAVKVIEYGFKGVGGWYINRSLKSIGQPDPVDDEYWGLMNSGIESDKALAKLLQRNTRYIVNILVISDKANPDNEGKVMKMKVTPSIWKIIEGMGKPQFDDETPVDVFDFWEGADFKMKAYNDTNGMRTYAKSAFAPSSPLFDDDAKIEEIYDSLESLQEELNPENKAYGDYAKLEKRLQEVLGRKLVKYRNANVETETTDKTDANLTSSFSTPTKVDTPTQSFDDDDLEALLNDD